MPEPAPRAAAPATSRFAARARRRIHEDTAIFGLLLVAGLVYGLMTSMVAPALPRLRETFDTSASTVAWIQGGYLLSAAILTPLTGRIADLFGRTRVLKAVMIAFAAGTAIAAVAPTIEVMIAGRVVQAAGIGIISIGVGILRELTGPEIALRRIAILMALLPAGTGGGLLLAGPIIDLLGTPWLYWVPLILFAPTVVLALVLLPPSSASRSAAPNWVGAGLAASTLLAALLTLSQGRSWPVLLTLAVLAASAVLATLWIRSERRAAVPFVDLSAFRSRAVWTVQLAAIPHGAVWFFALTLLPLLVIGPASSDYGLGGTATTAGLLVAPQAVTILLAIPASRLWNRRWGPRSLLFVGATVVAASFLLLAVRHQSALDIALTSAFRGAGIGLMEVSLAALIVSAVPEDETASALGVNLALRLVGGSIGAVGSAALLDATAIAGDFTSGGFTAAFLLAAGIAAAAAALVLVIPRATPPTNRKT